jgi:hypothetical protein
LFALSFLGLKAGRFPVVVVRGVLVFPSAVFVFPSRFFAVFFFAPRARTAFFLTFELRRLTMKGLAAPRTVDGSRLAQRIAEIPSTRTLGFERVMAADDAMLIVRVIRAKAAADGAALGD